MAKVALYTLLVVLFAAIAAAQNVGSPCVVPNPLRSGLYAAHPTDCGQFLQCVHGSFMARPCPRGLHWSTFHVTCNWPEFANCRVGGRSFQVADRPIPDSRSADVPIPDSRIADRPIPDM